MDKIQRFLNQSVLSYKALYGFYDPKMFLFAKLLNPLFQVIFFMLLCKFVYETNNISPWLVGNAMLLSVYNSMFGVANVMISERNFGTLVPVIISPSNKLLVFMGRAFIHVFDAAVTVFIGLLVGGIVFDVDFSRTNILALVICVLVTMYSSMSMGLLVGSTGLVFSDMNLIMNTFTFMFMIFTGAYFPITVLPKPFINISYFIPLTRGIEAARLVIKGDFSIYLFNLLGAEFLIGTLYLIAGYMTLKFFEKLARTKASLEIY